jgi:hypothetical protein
MGAGVFMTLLLPDNDVANHQTAGA